MSICARERILIRSNVLKDDHALAKIKLIGNIINARFTAAFRFSYKNLSSEICVHTVGDALQHSFFLWMNYSQPF